MRRKEMTAGKGGYMTPGFGADVDLAENETTSYMAATAKRALAQSDIPAPDPEATSNPFFHARHVRYKERFMQSMRRDLI